MLYKFIRTIGFIIFKILYRFEIVDYEKIPMGVPLVICPNHKSNWDPIFVSALIKFQIHWMAKKELWEVPLLGNLISALGAFAVDRDAVDIKAIKTSMRLLKENKAIGIFMEGTRVKEVNYSNAKAGAAVIAHRGSALIVPVYIQGNYFPFKKMKLLIKEPIDIREFPKQTPEQYEKIAVDILKSIYSGVEKN
ncbi:lysophospholipid acyltransferase family protein [Anaerosphaera multitolerans]|uniref:1-acyl-sn-glycerol-3-phosphate acyltransferase n=1 Tax=Anaerosphaera multitolerans TaxID=2487351 RepID=A0A437S7G6_9FIRM|nr:lysophospholipid acyltransferase family protein [Anaerosphaera multitolerans]RVU54942.1 1-acyl-sn-glycerol-3-phosphate acyltransferase [Anaerosphaera multitolerans]